jgi:integrase
VYLYKRAKNSKIWHAEIWIDGRKFPRSTGCTDKREAKTAAGEIEAVLRRELIEAAATHDSLLLNHVAGRYMQKVGNAHAGADNTRRLIQGLIEHFGADKPLTAIGSTQVLGLLAWRRRHKNQAGKPLSPYTVNDSIEQLKKLFTYCKRFEKIAFANEPDWRDEHLWLSEPQERVRELHEDERARLSAVMRDDYAPLFEYARLTGKRRDEVYTLAWSDVDWHAGLIRRKGKGERDVVVGISDAIRDLLWPLYQRRGEAAGVPAARERVFTYVAQRARDGRQSGQRYPVTLEGLKTAWRRLCRKAAVRDFRFHDYRHNFATKLLRETGNLKLTARALDHASTRSTERYAHVADRDLGTAVAALQEAMLQEAMAAPPAPAGAQSAAWSPRSRPLQSRLKVLKSQ